MTLYVHVIAQRHDHALDLRRKLTGGGEDEGLGFAHGSVDDLEHTNGKGRSFTSTRLGLRNCVPSFADLDNGARLDGRGRLVSIRVDTTKKAFYFRESISKLSTDCYLS
jgi:hypothetical protein